MNLAKEIVYVRRHTLYSTPKGLCALKEDESGQGDCICEEEHFKIQLLRGFVNQRI